MRRRRAGTPVTHEVRHSEPDRDGDLEDDGGPERRVLTADDPGVAVGGVADRRSWPGRGSTQREEWERFIRFFGADLVVVPGEQAQRRLDEFSAFHKGRCCGSTLRRGAGWAAARSRTWSCHRS